jgi:diguanylate cyclase (GGDEF)-like protein
MMAILLIKASTLPPDHAKFPDVSDLNYRATMLSSDGKINSLLFERNGHGDWSLDRAFLPVFQLTQHIENESQPVVLNFNRQLLWADLLGWGNMTILTLFAITLVIVPRLAAHHLRALTTAEGEQERATHLATHDALTGLPNRNMLADRFDQIYQNWKRNGTPFALALIDLDGFKKVNDQHGHDVGDEVLKAVSSRFSGVLRSTDTITRYGGDEFIALFVNVSNTDEGKQIGQKMLAAAARPIETTAGTMRINCSIGISICPVHGQSLDTLRNMADQAMYHSKERGGNEVSAFSPFDG